MGEFTKREYYEIEYGAFENLVNEVYGVEGFNFVETRECSNDSEYTFLAEKKELDDYEKKELQKFINNSTHCGFCTVDSIFDDLCNKGIIESGNYMVNVCW